MKGREPESETELTPIEQLRDLYKDAKVIDIIDGGKDRQSNAMGCFIEAGYEKALEAKDNVPVIALVFDDNLDVYTDKRLNTVAALVGRISKLAKLDPNSSGQNDLLLLASPSINFDHQDLRNISSSTGRTVIACQGTVESANSLTGTKGVAIEVHEDSVRRLSNSSLKVSKRSKPDFIPVPKLFIPNKINPSLGVLAGSAALQQPQVAPPSSLGAVYDGTSPLSLLANAVTEQFRSPQVTLSSSGAGSSSAVQGASSASQKASSSRSKGKVKGK